ncbi:hypothetical protein [Terrihabitans rhizophilus]|uniref:Uncharacterized protein n=1 Tax=Terrihabitans rhizophilus TaxID=3092662 RepID=A0ABU4RSM0_9HYPH|nr:hypothetical protein [Terrihabitans sp. PJ23]MDX6807153.1 hypothetical protein [Terrihabitans sp. PJ23]
MRTINITKKGIDNVLEGYRDGTTGRLMLDERGRAIDEVRRAFLSQVDELNPDYKTARGLYAGPAQISDAQQRGTMAVTRGRAAENVDEFSRMQPPAQQGFRIGYADKLNESIERAAPGVNKARGLTSQKTGAELGAFASPGRADRLGRQVERENTMFATSNTALGGSRTADNIADAAEMNGFDPEVLNNLFQGRLVAATLAAGRRILNEGKAMPPRVIERVGRALVETRPEMARAILEEAQKVRDMNASQRALVTSILTTSSAQAAGRGSGNSNRLKVTIP